MGSQVQFLLGAGIKRAQARTGSDFKGLENPLGSIYGYLLTLKHL
jgi:hypothetical protein